MVPERVSWNSFLPGILDWMKGEIICPKHQVKIGVDSYIVPSSDRKDLIFAVPFILSREHRVTAPGIV